MLNLIARFKQASLIMWLVVILIVLIPLKEIIVHVFPSFFTWQKQVFENAISFPLRVPSFIGYQGFLHVTELITLMIASYLFVKRPGYLKTLCTGPTLFLMLFTLASFCSIALSPCRIFFFPYFTLISLFVIAVFFEQVSAYFSSSHRFAMLVIGILIILGTFEGVVALFQLLAQKSMGLRIFGEHKLYLDKDPLIAAYPITNTLRSILNLFHAVPEARSSVLRSYGTMNHPNILAGFLLLTSITTINEYINPLLKIKKPLIISAFVIQFLGLIFTFSRGGLIGFFIAATSLLFFHIIQQKKPLKEVLRAHQKTVVIAITSLMLIGMALLPFYQARGGFVNHNRLVNDADSYRLLYQKQALITTMHKPLLGSGYGCFTFFPAPFLASVENTSHERADNFAITRDRPHNVFLMISSETGLIGLALFLSFFFVIFYQALINRKKLVHAGFVSALLGFMFIAMIDIYPLSDFEGKMLFFTTAALAWGSILLSKQRKEGLSHGHNP